VIEAGPLRATHSEGKVSLTYRVIGPAIKKKWLSKPVVPFRKYLGVYEEAFEMGVGIGYAHRNNLPWLTQLFAEKGREQELANALREMVQRHISGLIEANSLFDLGVFAEEARIKAEIRTRSFPETDIFSLSDDEIWELPKKLSKVGSVVDRMAEKLEIPVTTAFGNLQTVMSTGIGLGGAFPEKAEQFWAHQYEQPMTEYEEYEVFKLRAAGLNLPETMPKSLSLAQFAEQMRLVVDAFVSENWPDLVPQLTSGRQ
jgi:hypothetical protein